MGFIYNNTWEAFSKTYFELHGYFVTTNIFAALVPGEEVYELQEKGLVAKNTADKRDGRKSKIEADLLAYRIPETKLGLYEQDYDSQDRHADGGEFFAGDTEYTIGKKAINQTLVYTEVRANLSLGNPEQQINSLIGKGKKGKEAEKITRMTAILHQRLGIAPLVVIMAYSISVEQKKQIVAKGWKYKEFDKMWRFIERRMQTDYEVKKRVQYNDPFLEIFRYLERVQQK